MRTAGYCCLASRRGSRIVDKIKASKRANAEAPRRAGRRCAHSSGRSDLEGSRRSRPARRLLSSCGLLHIRPSSVQPTGGDQPCVLRVLRGPPAKPQSLYILGDLFEYWRGTTICRPVQRIVAAGAVRVTPTNRPSCGSCTEPGFFVEWGIRKSVRRKSDDVLTP